MPGLAELVRRTAWACAWMACVALLAGLVGLCLQMWELAGLLLAYAFVAGLFAWLALTRARPAE